MNSFLSSHIYLESWQTTTFDEEILGTLGDALRYLNAQLPQPTTGIRLAILYLLLYHEKEEEH